MLNETDIEAFRDDAAIFEAVNQRYLKGIPQHREMTAQEVPAYMRHAMRLQAWLSMALDERARRHAEAMSHGEPER